jgi:hypothetical protein
MAGAAIANTPATPRATWFDPTNRLPSPFEVGDALTAAVLVGPLFPPFAVTPAVAVEAPEETGSPERVAGGATLFAWVA